MDRQIIFRAKIVPPLPFLSRWCDLWLVTFCDSGWMFNLSEKITSLEEYFLYSAHCYIFQRGQGTKTEALWNAGIPIHQNINKSCKSLLFQAEPRESESDPLGVLAQLNSILETEEERFLIIIIIIIILFSPFLPLFLIYIKTFLPFFPFHSFFLVPQVL